MDEVVIADGPLEVAVLPEAGARLHRLRAFSHEILRTPDDPAAHFTDPFFWGGYVMAPWCNRIVAQPTDVEARRIDLPANFPDGTAIHGQVYLRPWERLADDAFRIAGGGDGWPWTYEMWMRLLVQGATLRIGLRLTNTSPDPMPAGMGIHPWFRRPLRVAIHADEVFDDNLATTAMPRPVEGALDLRSLRVMDDDLDGTWAGLGDPPVELQWDDLGLRMTMRTSPAVPYIVAASPGVVDAIAVEPETHAPQAIRRLLGGEPGALQVLPPGEALEMGIDLAFEQVS